MTDLHEATSIRTDGDSWEITESVGATALGVAAARAVETARDDALIRDEFAYLLVASAGPQWAQMASSDPDWLADDDEFRRLHEMSRDYQAVRTHYFDDYFHAAMRAGIRQVVILAAGLDSRAYRLEWPAGTTVFEIDQPKVLEYKTSTLDAHGAQPKARRDSGGGRPARRLARGADRRGLRRHAADRVAGRGAAAVSAARRAGSALRTRHGAQRGGQPDRGRGVQHGPVGSGRTGPDRPPRADRADAGTLGDRHRRRHLDLRRRATGPTPPAGWPTTAGASTPCRARSR